MRGGVRVSEGWSVMSFRFLSWLTRNPRRKAATEIITARVKFLGEQDGPVERTIKAQWLPILSADSNIRRAFLVRAAYERADDVHVLLALCSNVGPDPGLIEALRVPYAAIFHRDCPLDTVFVSAAQEAHIERVCPPFYTGA
jgi:hypothetical protein